MEKIWRQLLCGGTLPKVITMIGGGGKTSLLYYLIGLLQGQGIAAIGTTTTKMSRHCSLGRFIEIDNVVAAQQAVKEVRNIAEPMVLVTGPDPKDLGKMVGCPAAWIEELAAREHKMVFVVEGDGSAGKSLKGHLPHDPVIPNLSAMVIVMIGIDSLGALLLDDNVHRSKRVSELLGKQVGDVVTREMVTQLLFHPQGYLHNCPAQSEIILFINKVESTEKKIQAEKLASELLAYRHPQVKGVIIGSVLRGEAKWLPA